jgi:hypothetical protein
VTNRFSTWGDRLLAAIVPEVDAHARYCVPMTIKDADYYACHGGVEYHITCYAERDEHCFMVDKGCQSEAVGSC